jgi:C-terminal processing protease CtpA/Prc
MIRPLGELHTGIEAPQIKRESKDSFRAGTDRIIKGGIEVFATRGRRALFAVTDSVWSHGPIRSFCNGQVQFGVSSNGVGYMRILSFGGYSKHARDSRALESTLDRIFSDQMLKALIVDVRLSFGGDDGLGRVIASRLTDREYLAYAIQARSDPVNAGKWTSVNQVFVHPSSRPSFRGPVVELIGPITMSAAETFTQALMGRTPRVTMVGENTQGLFCDPLDRHLPNGWSYSLPNAVYRTTDERAFDVLGIPPDITARVFADDDVAARKDPAMAVALKILSLKSEP